MKTVQFTESSGVFKAHVKTPGQRGSCTVIRDNNLFRLLDTVVEKYPSIRFAQETYKALARRRMSH